MDKRSVTEGEMLLAIACSQFYGKHHVLFIPPGTEYVKMLTIVERRKLVKRSSSTTFELTLKGRRKILAMNKDRSSEADKAIDEFIDKL